MDVMLKMGQYDYFEATYELEINLHRVRIELITMMDSDEQAECEHCLHLECILCIKFDSRINRNQSNKSDTKSTNNKEPCAHKIKAQAFPLATAFPKPFEQGDLSPVPSTPEKQTNPRDIEIWMEASKKLQDYADKMASNPNQSLVTIESVRPADLPLKTVQGSTILNSSTSNLLNGSSLLNSSNLLHSSNNFNGLNFWSSSNFGNSDTKEAFFKHFKQFHDKKVVHIPPTSTMDYNNQYYSYFHK